jgi:hypothetical protein
VQELNLDESQGAFRRNAFDRNNEGFLERECVLNFLSQSLSVAMATSTPTLIKIFLNRSGSLLSVMQ